MTDRSPSSCGIELSVVVPFYNEETLIAQTIQQVHATLQRMAVSWELILVDDGSTDQSQQIARQNLPDKANIRLLAIVNNRGRGYALRQGFHASRGRLVISTEADLSWGAEIIPRLYDALLHSGADVVIASPHSPQGGMENVPAWRVWLSRYGNVFLRHTVSAPITTVSGMTRGYIGERIRSLPLFEDRKEIHLEIVSKAAMLGFRFSEIPALLHWQEPTPGAPQRQSKFNLKHLLKTHVYFGFSEAPALLFGTLGGGVLLWGLGQGFYLAWLYFIRHQVVGDKVVLILTTVFLVLSGLSLLLFGWLAMQIRDMKKELYRLYHHGQSLVRGSSEGDAQ